MTRSPIGSDDSCRAAKADGETAGLEAGDPLLGTKGPGKANLNGWPFPSKKASIKNCRTRNLSWNRIHLTGNLTSFSVNPIYDPGS